MLYLQKLLFLYLRVFQIQGNSGGGGGGTQTLEKLRPRKVNESQLKITALKRRLNNWPWTFNMCIKLQIVQVNNRQW